MEQMTIEQVIAEQNVEYVYNLMVEREFPYLPEEKEEAIKQLMNKNVSIIVSDSQCVFIFIDKNEKLYLDVLIPKKLECKWLSKKLIQLLKRHIQELGYSKVILEPVTARSYNLCKNRFKEICYNFYEIDINNYLNV